jgi:hypothetical protein
MGPDAVNDVKGGVAGVIVAHVVEMKNSAPVKGGGVGDSGAL